MTVDQKSERNDQALQESCRLRGLHAYKHGLEKVRQNGKYALPGVSEKMDDEVTNDESTRLVLALKQASDKC